MSLLSKVISIVNLGHPAIDPEIIGATNEEKN